MSARTIEATGGGAATGWANAEQATHAAANSGRDRRVIARQYEHGAVLSIQVLVQRVAHLVAAILSHVFKSRHMAYDLSHFDLGDMLKSSLRLREAATGAPTLEAAAQRVCRFLYDELSGPDTERACALVRCYKTHPYGSLEPELQRFAKMQMKGDEEPRSSMKCLTLLATVGQNAAWNSRFLSMGHRAVPPPSPEIVEKAPMISQLIKELGLELGSLLQGSPDVVKELVGKRHGVFHVEDAAGSPYIPAQREFVEKYGIRSVLGFGGVLATGDLFAVILFSTVHVPATAAQRFRTLALDVKSAFSKFSEANVFNAFRSTPTGPLRKT